MTSRTGFADMLGEIKEVNGNWEMHGYDGRGQCYVRRTFKTELEAEEALQKHIKFTEGFWNEKVRWKENGDRTAAGQICFRIDGQHYVGVPGKPAGYGHHEFAILKDGEEIKCELWTQGVIPEEYRDRLPDNATWA